MNNLIARTLTGVLFVVLLVGAIVWSPVSFIILFTGVTAATVWEFSGNVNACSGANVNRLINTVAAAYLFIAFAAYCNGYQGPQVFIPYLLSVLYLPISELYLRQPDPLRNWGYAFASQLYVALPFALLSVLAFVGNDAEAFTGYNWRLPLSVFIFLWVGDTGAYCVGSLLHKRFPAKLFERISPNKSWVGSVGGGLLCLVAAVVLWQAFTGVMTLPQWMGLALTVCVFGTWGDLVESLLKRHWGIKDSGSVLPGHGGWLDRFDSALMAIPAAVLYVYTLNTFA